MDDLPTYSLNSTILKPLKDFIVRLIDHDSPIEQHCIDDVINWCINTEDYSPRPESARYILDIRNQVESYPELHAQLIHYVTSTKAAIYANVQSVDQYFNPSEPHYLNSCYHVVVLQMVP